MTKRLFIFLLISMVLFNSIPENVFASGVIKRIDVYEDNLRLSVEGNSFSHKKIFLYDGDIFVPMKDFGSALGLGVSFNSSNRTMNLYSNGKLSFSDDSNYPISYQRGYEIDAKVRLKEYLENEIQGFLRGTKAKPFNKSMELRTIAVSFSDIGVFLDGNDTGLGSEAFIYGDDVYLPLTLLSPHLYITPYLGDDYIDVDANGILIDKPKYKAFGFIPEYYSIEELVRFREEVNSKYARELEELNKRKKVVMDVKIPYEEIRSLRDMERYLNKYLGRIRDLDLDIRLRLGTGHWYYLDIDFPSRYDYRWRNLTRRDVESHVWDIYVAISNLYDEDARIQGRFKKYVSFDTKGKNMVFSFINSKLDLGSKVDAVLIRELLQKEFYRYNRVYFDYDVRVSGYDLELVVEPSHRDFMEKWYPDEKLDYLERLSNEIRRYHPGLRVNGKILYDEYEHVDFVIEENMVRSQKLLEETSQYLNEFYGTLYAPGLRIPIKYSLHEVDADNFKLMVDLDYSTGQPAWNTTAKDELSDLMNSVMKYVVGTWDANVFVQVFDLSQSLVYEYIVSQDTVQMVMANPSGGDVVEGTTVALSTATIGANIYYTTDGTMPTANSNLYKSPIVIGSNTIIKAFAVKEGFKDSPVSTFQYSVTEDKDMASGLDDLTFSKGTLSPSFSKKDSNYSLNLPHGTAAIGITAFASTGNITIGDSSVTSGTSFSVNVKDGDTIDVVHSEDGKSKDRIYRIDIKIGDKVESNVKLGEYSFNTLAIPSIGVFQYFNGKLVGDFRDHEIWILSTTGKKYSRASIDIDGSFEITDFPVDVGSRVIGYRYEILDTHGNVVSSDVLNER